jgi:hypothetical protein
VDDTDDEGGEKTAGGGRKARGGVGGEQKKQRRAYTNEAHQEAIDIFGVDVGELEALEEGESERDDEEGDEDDEYYSGEEEEEEEDEEGRVEEDEDGNVIPRRRSKATAHHQKSRRRNRHLLQHKLEDLFEPDELEKNFMTERDQQIRMEDKPERFMLRGSFPVTSEPDEAELEREAEWIYTHAFSAASATHTISKQVCFFFFFILGSL